MKLKSSFARIGLVTTVVLLLVGCGPPRKETSTQVKSNEVGYSYSLEGDVVGTAGAATKELAPDNRLQSRTIIHGQRKKYYGYTWQWWAYEWIPTDAVTKTSLLPVAREWTQRGTIDRGFPVESLDSIGCTLGSSVQCDLISDKTHLFFSRYGGMELGDVADTVVWGYMLSRATFYFGQIEIAEFPEHLNSYAAKILEDAQAYFEPQGIRISTFGWVGGIRYDQGDIQTQLDKVFVAENDLTVATQEQSRQRQRNAMELQHAIAEQRQALALWANRHGAVLRAMLDLRGYAIQADENLVKQWNGVGSETLPSGLGVLWFLGHTGIEEQIAAISKIAEVKDPELDKRAADVADELKREAEKRSAKDRLEVELPNK